VNSIEVVFIPSRSEVMRARSATESRPKYSSRSIAWWLSSAGVRVLYREDAIRRLLIALESDVRGRGEE